MKFHNFIKYIYGYLMLKISILHKSNKAEKKKYRSQKQQTNFTKTKQHCDPDSDSKDRYV